MATGIKEMPVYPVSPAVLATWMAHLDISNPTTLMFVVKSIMKFRGLLRATSEEHILLKDLQFFVLECLSVAVDITHDKTDSGACRKQYYEQGEVAMWSWVLLLLYFLSLRDVLTHSLADCLRDPHLIAIKEEKKKLPLFPQVGLLLYELGLKENPSKILVKNETRRVRLPSVRSVADSKNSEAGETPSAYQNRFSRLADYFIITVGEEKFHLVDSSSHGTKHGAANDLQLRVMKESGNDWVMYQTKLQVSSSCFFFKQ